MVDSVALPAHAQIARAEVYNLSLTYSTPGEYQVTVSEYAFTVALARVGSAGAGGAGNKTIPATVPEDQEV